MMQSVVHISVKMFNRDAALFSNSAAMRAYAEKASAGLGNLGLKQKDNGLVAAIILFSSTLSTNHDQLNSITELSSIQVSILYFLLGKGLFVL
jgi:hypothetical protein